MVILFLLDFVTLQVVVDTSLENTGITSSLHCCQIFLTALLNAFLQLDSSLLRQPGQS